MFSFKFYKQDIAHIQFHKNSWVVHQDSGNDRSWYTEQRDPVRLQLFDRAPAWPFDLKNEKAARDFFEAQAQSLDGAMIELAVETIAGLECLVGVFKYKSPVPNHLGMYYVGIVWIPFEKFTFQINFESLETGSTGAREAAVAMLTQREPVTMAEEPVMLSSVEDLFTKLRKNPVRALPSDDKKYDATFVEHPLSKVRGSLEHFRRHLIIDKRLLKQKPYRKATT